MDGVLVQDLMRLAVTAFALCVVPVPILRDLFRARGIVDTPGGRKVHSEPTPRVGGIAIVVAYGLTLFLQSSRVPASTTKILIPMALVFLTGLLDDIRGLKPSQKLLGQASAAVAAVLLGIRINTIAGVAIPAPAAFVLTVGWLVLCSNAFNLIDGLNGLCAGLGAIGAISLAAGAALTGDDATARLAIPLAGALVGFLRFNFWRADIFLGDSGALTIGFLLGCVGVMGQGNGPVGIALPFAAVAIPVLDVAVSIVRRWIAGRRIFSADREHIHHKLLERGLKQAPAVLVLYAAAVVMAVFALTLNHPAAARLGIASAVLPVIATLWGIHQLRYPEFQWRDQMLRVRQPLR